MYKKLFTIFAFLLLLLSGCSTQRLSEQTGYCSVPGGQIWFKIMGDGGKAPLVCVHGGPGGSSCGYVRLSPLGNERPFNLVNLPSKKFEISRNDIYFIMG
ncbi:MAG: hypothetical protein ACM339_08300 [Ignavibacteria bacterium]